MVYYVCQACIIYVRCIVFLLLQTSHTLLWTLYSLAINREAQTKLREEVVRVLGSDPVVTPTHIQHMSYMKDCIKETMRYVRQYAWYCANLHSEPSFKTSLYCMYLTPNLHFVYCFSVYNLITYHSILNTVFP